MQGERLLFSLKLTDENYLLIDVVAEDKRVLSEVLLSTVARKGEMFVH